MCCGFLAGKSQWRGSQNNNCKYSQIIILKKCTYANGRYEKGLYSLEKQER